MLDSVNGDHNMVEIGQISLRKPRDWNYSIGSQYSNVSKLLHFFSKQIHPQMFIGIITEPPSVYGGYYRIVIKKYYLKVPHHTKEINKIPIDIVNNVETIDEINNPYPEDIKRFLLQSFKKYGKVIKMRT